MARGYAIHVAINRYCNTAICRVRGELLTCVEAGRALHAMAQESGFESHLLIDARAWYANFADLLRRANGDHLLLTFSGHGAVSRPGWMFLDRNLYFDELQLSARAVVISNSCRSGVPIANALHIAACGASEQAPDTLQFTHGVISRIRASSPSEFFAAVSVLPFLSYNCWSQARSASSSVGLASETP